MAALRVSERGTRFYKNHASPAAELHQHLNHESGAICLHTLQLPRAMRFCPLCPGHHVGDERHLVFECPALQHIRQHYAGIYSDAHSTMRLFMWHKDQKAMASCLLRLLSEERERERGRFNHMSIRPTWPMRTSHCSRLSQLKDGCQAIRNILLVLVPHKGAHGTTTAVIQISILSSNSIKKWAFKTEMALITNI